MVLKCVNEISCSVIEVVVPGLIISPIIDRYKSHPEDHVNKQTKLRLNPLNEPCKTAWRNTHTLQQLSLFDALWDSLEQVMNLITGTSL